MTDEEFTARVREADLRRLDRAARQLKRDGWVDPRYVDEYLIALRDVMPGHPVPSDVAKDIARVEAANAAWVGRYRERLIRVNACTAVGGGVES